MALHDPYPLEGHIVDQEVLTQYSCVRLETASKGLEGLRAATASLNSPGTFSPVDYSSYEIQAQIHKPMPQSD